MTTKTKNAHSFKVFCLYSPWNNEVERRVIDDIHRGASRLEHSTPLKQVDSHIFFELLFNMFIFSKGFFKLIYIYIFKI